MGLPGAMQCQSIFWVFLPVVKVMRQQNFLVSRELRRFE